MAELDIGIVGAAGRGGSFVPAIDHHDRARIRAVCDVDQEALADTRDALGADEAYEDYETMLDESDLDMVIVGTPMPYHASMSIAALERDLHVLSEVPAGVSVDECRDLVAASRDSAGTYAMAENYVYMRPNMIVKELVRAGLFGEPYYAEGEYIHELKDLNEETPWRREWQTGIDGLTYPTHSLGPILQWWPDDRVARVTCGGSGHHYVDPRGDEYEQQDTTVMLAETERDRLIKIRLDMLSERPHAMDNYQLQGTEGCYESARADHYDPEPGGFDTHKVWLDEYEDSDDSHDYEWIPLSEMENEYLPDLWRRFGEDAAASGHGGGDYILMCDVLDTLLAGESPRIGIHEAMNMTLPGLVSQDSIERDGEWLSVPDSREW